MKAFLIHQKVPFFFFLDKFYIHSHSSSFTRLNFYDVLSNLFLPIKLKGLMIDLCKKSYGALI